MTTKPKRKPGGVVALAVRMAAITLAAWNAQGFSKTEQRRRLAKFERALDAAEKRRALKKKGGKR